MLNRSNIVSWVSKSLIFSLSMLVIAACDNSPAEIEAPMLLKSPVDTKVGEGFSNPLGYYESRPRFSWKINSDSLATSQTAYRIQVASSLKLLLTTPDLWDSEKVRSSKNAWVQYQGSELSSRQLVYWRTRIWDQDNKMSKWSDTQTVELGLLDNNDWQGQWIGHQATAKDAKPNQDVLATPQYLRKTFTVEGQLLHARLYISAKGLFSPFINGEKVSQQDVMTPGWTPYAKRIESLTYDLSDRLVQGENAIAASIAGGWYAMRVHNFHDRDHHSPARLLAQLELVYADGRTETVVSDDSWLATQEGPIRFASIYDGEKYEQNKEIKGWNNVDFENTAAFDKNTWSSAISEPLDSDVDIRPKRHEPIRVTQQMPVVEIVSANDGKVVLDFGQNMVGVPSIKVPAIAGQEIKVKFAEALHKGEFYTENYRSAVSTNFYTPSETGIIEYTPTFTYHGYRYIEISGYDASVNPSKDWAIANIQHSDIDLHASFKSSHPKLNQLAENIVWGMRSNFYDIPLDCPQRDERLGWTGDAQVFVTPSMYMADVYGFWSAWLQSVREEQGEDGKIPLYIPFVEWINFASSGWGDAVTIIPWELYVMTGDKTILSDNYDMMKGWIKFHQKKSQDYVSNMTTFGDWLQPFPVIEKEGDNGNRGNTNFSLIGTAYFAQSIALTIKTAEALGKTDDIAELSSLHKKVKDAFLAKFFDENLDLIDAMPTQTTYLLGLAYDLFPKEKNEVAVSKLIALIENADTHLRTGFLGTPLLTQVLQEAGRSDVIYDILFKESYPSWFYSINNGATTTWERWNSYSIEDGFNPQGMNSLNHYAYGTVSRWFYEGILGIKPSKPGFKRITIEPQFGSQLSQASGEYETVNGKVSVAWELQSGFLIMDVTVPKNSSSDVILPPLQSGSLSLDGMTIDASALLDLQPGSYQIRAQLSTG